MNILILFIHVAFGLLISNNLLGMTTDQVGSKLYLDLMKKCLINSIYQDPSLPDYAPYDTQKREGDAIGLA